jgi:hypothetical protein
MSLDRRQIAWTLKLNYDENYRGTVPPKGRPGFYSGSTRDSTYCRGRVTDRPCWKLMMTCPFLREVHCALVQG